MTESTEKFILDHSKMSGGVRTMPQTSYLDYMKTNHQITPETIHALTAAEKTLVTGAIAVGTEDLKVKIIDAKDKGEDPEGLHGVVKIARPDGQLKIDIDAQFESRNPKTQEKLKRFGRVTVVAKASSLIDEAAELRTSEIITALMS